MLGNDNITRWHSLAVFCYWVSDMTSLLNSTIISISAVFFLKKKKKDRRNQTLSTSLTHTNWPWSNYFYYCTCVRTIGLFRRDKNIGIFLFFFWCGKPMQHLLYLHLPTYFKAYLHSYATDMYMLDRTTKAKSDVLVVDEQHFWKVRTCNIYIIAFFFTCVW